MARPMLRVRRDLLPSASPGGHGDGRRQGGPGRGNRCRRHGHRRLGLPDALGGADASNRSGDATRPPGRAAGRGDGPPPPESSATVVTPEAEVYRRFEDRAAHQLTKRQLPLIVGKATDAREIRRREIFAPFDLQGLRGAAEGVRAHTLANLDTYLDRFATRAEARGTKVFFA